MEKGEQKMGLKVDLDAVAHDVKWMLDTYLGYMASGDYRKADEVAARMKLLVNELHNEAWHSYHTSGTGAI
jgi:hypothetical protein